MNSKLNVGITFGDPAGIGPEIIYKVLIKLDRLRDCNITIIGDRWVFERINKVKKFPREFKFIDLKNVRRNGFRFGRTNRNCAMASLEYIDKAIDLIKNREVDCLVTCPISKEAISLLGLSFSGHTAYLANKFKTKTVMMLLNKYLKFSLLTEHIPLMRVGKFLNYDKFLHTILVTYESLERIFLINRPKIVVLGLNPHASDGGNFGDEEIRKILPILKALRKKIKDLAGPLPADSAILKLKNKEYDCAIALYHDQALIPLKLSSPYTGVNLTLGLPFIRTSPLHGTAFDIAGKNIASELSLWEALKLAVKFGRNLKSS